MFATAANYDVKILSVQHIRSCYLPLVAENAKIYYGNNFKITVDELESCFEWLVLEAMTETFKCRVIGHYRDDFAKGVYQTFPTFLRDIGSILAQTNFMVRREQIHHLKGVVMGEFLFVGALVK